MGGGVSPRPFPATSVRGTEGFAAGVVTVLICGMNPETVS